MREESPRFVRRILAFHVFLLAAALTLVALASAEIYKSTRDDALSQARIRQELLAYDTSRGIQTYFASVIKDLAWIQGPQEPATGPSDAISNPAQRLEGRRPMVADIIADQLGDSVAFLFVYNKQTNAVTPFLPVQSKLNSKQLPGQMIQWLKAVSEPSVSRLMWLDGQRVVLVAAPFSSTIRRNAPAGRNGAFSRGATLPALIQAPPRLLIAAIPGRQIDANFLPMLSDQPGSTVTLADARLQVITSSSPILEGMNLGDFDDPDAVDLISNYQADPAIQTRFFTQPLSIYGAAPGEALSIYTATLGPQMVTLAPVVVAGDQWTLLFADPLANVDAAVKTLFKRAVFWAGFVAASITAILVSTAVQMIRWRARLEQMRHEMLKRQLLQARQIQEQWLPQVSRDPDRLDVAAVNEPASHISGDFYNWFDLPDGRQAVVIGDVTGHGMAAAFLMATTQLLVRNILTRLGDAGAAMEEVNDQLCSQMFHGQFVTMLILTLDARRDQLAAASAGHPPPLLGTDGTFRPLEMESQLVLGVEKNVRYPTQRFDLPEHSSLLLYTDGLVDARNSQGERYGKPRLLAALASSWRGGAAEMAAAVKASVREFRAGGDLDDDLTLVAIQLRPVANTPARSNSLTVSAGS